MKQARYICKSAAEARSLLAEVAVPGAPIVERDNFWHPQTDGEIGELERQAAARLGFSVLGQSFAGGYFVVCGKYDNGIRTYRVASLVANQLWICEHSMRCEEEAANYAHVYKAYGAKGEMQPAAEVLAKEGEQLVAA